MTGRSFVLSIATTAVVFAIAGRCTAPDPAALPPKIEANVARHRVLAPIDSAEILRLKRAAVRDSERLIAQVAITRRTDSAALRQRHRADTLQAVALAALTEAEREKAWHAAYDARSIETDSLRSSNVRKDSIITVTMHGWAVTDSALTRQAGHSMRSDSLIAELLPLARHRDQCKIAWVLTCPTRRQAFVGGVLAGVATYAVATGKIKIPIALLKF